MAPAVRVGITATKAPWAKALRAFVRDHASGVTVETLMSTSQLPEPGQRGLEVLIVDDQMPLFKAGHIAAVQAQGTKVIGLWDETSGRGRDYVIDLGVDEPIPASMSPSELVQTLLRIAPVNIRSDSVSDDLVFSDRSTQPHSPMTVRSAGLTRRATTTNFTSVCGGTGQTETIVAVAECLARRAKVLVVEAAGATLAQRLRRAPEYGLAWSLERVAAGHRAFPGGLSPGQEDGTRPLGRADVICGTAAPAGPPPVSAVHLAHLLDQAATEYDHVLIESGSLSTASAVAGGDRFAVARAVLSRADQVVVFASADPCGARKLVEWRSVLHHDLGLELPCIAVFGRAPTRRFERAALQDVIERNTGRVGFSAVCYLPEDTVVGRARWDGVLVTKGNWAQAVTRLASDLGRVRSTKPAPDEPVLRRAYHPVQGHSRG